MSNFSIDLTRATRPTNTMGSPAESSANWGTVYQNYISVNLVSESLAKGAYDAYNLLTTGKLSSIVDSTFNYIQTVENNVETLADSVAARVTTESNRIDNIVDGLNNLFVTTDSKKPDQQAIIALKNTLNIQRSDTVGTPLWGEYSGNQHYNLDLAGLRDSSGNIYPGLIRGERALQLGRLMQNAFSTSLLPRFYSDTVPNSLIPNWSLAPYERLQPMQILVYQVNQLQMQIENMRQYVNKFFSGELGTQLAVDTLYVKKIRFVEESNGYGSIPLGAQAQSPMYLNYTPFTMPTEFTDGDL